MMPETWSRSSSDGGAEVFPWRFLPFVILTALAIVGLDRLNGTPTLNDVDDILRSIQIRQLLLSRHWYDLSLPIIRMPDAYLSPWSRLIDAPYFAITWALSFFLPEDVAMHWSFLIWPPVMLVGYAVLAFTIIRKLPVAGLTSGVSIAIAMILFMFLAIFEFTPGRIDHHNVQIILLFTMVVGALQWTRLGGLLVGIATALSVAVGLECMPIIAVLLGGVVISWLLNAQGGERMMRWTMWSTAVATPVTALVLIGPAGILSTQCDAFSGTYIYIASCLAAAAGLTTSLVRPDCSLLKKLMVLLPPGLVIVAGFAVLFPSCLAGPYGIIDPVSRHFWFERIQQENSILDFFRGNALLMVTMVAGEVVIVLLAFPVVLSQVRKGNAREAIVFATAVSALVFTILLTRFIRFPAALVPLFLPMAVGRLVALGEGEHGKMAAFRAFAVAFVPVFAVTVLADLATPRKAENFDSIDVMNIDDCRRDNFASLATLPPGIIMAPPGLGLGIATRAPSGLSVSAIPFHRASPGMRRTYLAFTTSDVEVRKEAMAPFDYLAVCRVGVDLDDKAPLFNRLAHGGVWPGLEPIGDLGPDKPLRLFRINHNQLQ